MDRCPKNEATVKILFEIKALPFSRKVEKPVGGGGGEEVDVTPTPIGGLNLRHVTGDRKYSIKFIGLCS